MKVLNIVSSFGLTVLLGSNALANLYCSSAKGIVTYGMEAGGPPGNQRSIPLPNHPQVLSPWFVNGQRVASDAFSFDDSSKQILETQRPEPKGRETYTVKAIERTSGEYAFLICEETWGPKS